jgi:hypothetical protein
MVYVSADGTVGGKKSLWKSFTDFLGGTFRCPFASMTVSPFSQMCCRYLYADSTVFHDNFQSASN